MSIRVREIRLEDRTWIAELLAEKWRSTRVVSRGRLHRADRLPGFVAVLGDERVGLLTYRIESDACEVVTLNAVEPGRGAGSALLRAAARAATAARCRRLWAVTTNDNAPAIAFYERCGFELVAVHEGAVAEARRLKPELPRIGRDGVEIRDELEFERRLRAGRARPARVAPERS